MGSDGLRSVFLDATDSHQLFLRAKNEVKRVLMSVFLEFMVQKEGQTHTWVKKKKPCKGPQLLQKPCQIRVYRQQNV